MDNSQMPPVQMTGQPYGMPMGQSNGAPMGQPNGMPMVQQIETRIEPKKDSSGLVKTIVIIILSLVSITFVGLFVWMFIQYDEVKTDVNGQINLAVIAAKDEQAAKDEEEFSEREKSPYRVFAGPADYGQLSFEYPKTWSVYVASDTVDGGDFEAYLNPVQVEPVSNSTVNALRVTIRNRRFDEVVEEYQQLMNYEESDLTVESVTINGVTANRYTGTLPKTEFSGYVVIFKIRDKTAILQTDSLLFQADFDKLLETVEFNA